MTEYTNDGATTAYDVADAFLKSIGAPNTPSMRRAVAIWLSQEGNPIRGNNPWNLHHGSPCKASSGYCPGSDKDFSASYVGNRYAGSGDQNVAVFSSISSGSAANAQNLLRLANSGYGYDRVIAQARAGSGYGFLKALQDSKWSEGHYAHHKLTDAYSSGGGKNFSIKLLQPKGSPDTPDTSTALLNPFNWDAAHILTKDDLLQLQKWAVDRSPDTNKTQLTTYLGTLLLGLLGGSNYEGLTFGQLQKDAPGLFGAPIGAKDVGAPTDPITAVADAVGQVGNQLADTATWIGFIMLGLVLIIGGFYLLGGSSKSDA